MASLLFATVVSFFKTLQIIIRLIFQVSDAVKDKIKKKMQAQIRKQCEYIQAWIHM